jgi:hypothetical protein
VENNMTKFKLLATAVLLSMATATPVLAQAAIEEPGAYAFYHPNGDLGIGSAQPMQLQPMQSMASLPLRHRGHVAQAREGRMSRQALARHARSANSE